MSNCKLPNHITKLSTSQPGKVNYLSKARQNPGKKSVLFLQIQSFAISVILLSISPIIYVVSLTYPAHNNISSISRGYKTQHQELTLNTVTVVIMYVRPIVLYTPAWIFTSMSQKRSMNVLKPQNMRYRHKARSTVHNTNPAENKARMKITQNISNV